MPKTSTDLIRHALNGPTMGTSWSALFYADTVFDLAPVQAALQRAVSEVDAAMSTWKPDSDLMRLNRAPDNMWVDVPAELAQVLELGLRIGRRSAGAFDIGMGDAVRAWGFGSEEANPDRIRSALATVRRPAHELLEIDPAGSRVRKHGPITLDLNGIAKGHGVDRLAGTLQGYGIAAALVGIDGEMRAMGLRSDGNPWTVAIEAPDLARRAIHSILALQDAAVATSGDYRHFVTVQGRRLSHTMNPATSGPLRTSPVSATVVARTCAEADAWASALMVLGPEAGGKLVAKRGLDALLLMRDGGEIRPYAIGTLFGGAADSVGRDNQTAASPTPSGSAPVRLHETCLQAPPMPVRRRTSHPHSWRSDIPE